jgi:hypothetical protein
VIAVRFDRRVNYPNETPFHPSEKYPECPFDEWNPRESNQVYAAIRQLFLDLSLDSENYGTESWNPLGKYVPQNGKIAIKPNWVWDPPYCFSDPGSLPATITHSSILRAIIDYSYIAVGRNGMISVLDSPIEDTNWARLHMWNGFKGVMHFYETLTEVPVELIDIRDFRSVHSKQSLPIGRNRVGLVHRKKLVGDPRGYVEFDLGGQSEFTKMNFTGPKNMRSPQKWTGKRVLKYHDEHHHVYSISRTLLEADLILNVPKLKHHKKAGVTLSLKNLIGATNKKNGLPHFKKGFPPYGDEHPYPRSYGEKIKIALSNANLLGVLGLTLNRDISKMQRLPCDVSTALNKCLRRIRVGDWYGSDTLWRTILDLNKAVLCGDLNGLLHESRQRDYLSIIDGIVGGERLSPLHPTPRKAGLLLTSEDPVALDTAAAYFMGFNPHRIPTIQQSWKLPSLRKERKLPLDQIEVLVNGNTSTVLSELANFLRVNPQYMTRFTPSVGWKHHIELE